MQTSRFAAASLAAFVCLLWSSVASASFTASPDPASLGTAVLVGTTSSTTITITHNGTVSETLTSVTKAATVGCATMTLTPNPPGLPWTTAVDGATRTIDVDFDPIARGARTCTVTMRDPGGVAIGTFVLNGTGVAPELAVVPTSLDFAGTPVAGGTVQRTFDIENNGDAGLNLAIDSVTLGGGSPGDYSLSAAPGAPIAPGGSFTMTVTFNPTAAGTRDATITVTAAGDPVDSTETVDLTGVGQIPTISHTTPDPMTFSVIAGTQSAAQTITLRNTGDAPLTVTQAVITNGGGWIEFTAIPQAGCDNATGTCNYTPDLTLAPLTNQNVGIRCQPPMGATGSQNATVTFSSDSVGGDNTVAVDCSATKPDIMVSTTALTFGPTPVVAGTDTDTVTVMNVGNATLTYDISITGANPGDFTYTGVQCTTLAPCTLAMGNMRTFTVTFNPPADGNRSATMSFNSDDQETDTVDVSLMGVATGAEIVRVTGDIDFGQVQVGTSSIQRPLTLRNDGTTDNLVVTVVLSNTSIYSFAPGTTFPLTIPPTGSATVNIICTPTARQNYPALATANNNSWNDTSLDTNLSCQGINGDLRISGVLPPPEASFSFGNVNQGQSVNQTFVLRNFGELAVNSITSSIAPSTAGYTVMGVPTSLAPLTQVTITVTFSPTMTADGGPATLTVDGDLDDALLLLDGNGLSNGIDTDPSALDYGEVRWDQTRVMTFLATNTGESTLTMSQAMLSDTTNFAITQVRIDQTGNGTFETTQPGVPPNVVLCGAGDTTALCPGATGGIAEFSVRFQPEDTLLGTKSGMLTLICSLPAPDNMRVVTLTGISASPALTVEPGVVIDFGGVDLDGALPATQVLSLRNSGAAAVNLNVDSHTAVTAPFAATGFSPGPVAMGASNDTTFEYTPTVEQAAPGDTQVVTYSLTGLHTSVGPNSVMITLQGHGTDRHFISNGPVTFPPTYKNPAVPPEQDITVMNTGEAPLDVSALMLTGDPAFTLVDMTPLVVAPMTTATFTVRFNPTMAGDFNGVVGITHDDNGIASPPTSQVLVTGMGIDREMTFLPTIEIGTAIVGDELRRDDLISLINMSDQTGHPTTFTVRALTIADTSGVLTIDDPAATPVAPATTEQFGGSFTPTVAGRFETTLQIFLDQDPDPHGTITLTGHAVEVEIKGGGCAASGGGEAATVIVVLVLAFGLRRRRALRHAGAAVVVLGGVLAWAPAADADVTVQSFHPLPSIEDDLFEVESATVGQANAWAAGLSLTYARDPLISTVTSCGNECPPPDPISGDAIMVGDSASLVKQQTVIGVGGAFAIANRFEVGLVVPIMMQSGDSAMIGAAADGTTLGDIAAHAKIQFVRAGTLAIGAAAVITAPTAKDGQYAGYSGPSGELELLASHRSRRVLASINVGFRGRKTEDFATVQQGSAVTFGAGAGFRVTSSLWIAAEAFGDYGVVSDSQPSLQALGGLRARLGNAITVGIGGGAGLVDGIGVPKARGFLLLSYSPAMRPLEPLRRPPPPPDTRDSDGDTVLNTADKCPNEAEDIDLFDDADGCPDFDNDGDGVVDASDQCASEPEDPDGFQDVDGCPDGDNDGDGIADKTDVCPNDVEDKDGHADLDGCPDDDNDHDGVSDATDKCQNQPETINGNNDDDGCPDRGDSLVLLAADRIELLEPVKFSGTGTKLGKASLNLLAQVGATLRANPEIIRLRVTAHVHPRWTSARDQTLSDDRAKAVKDWLVAYGIKADRIDARGFGSQKPLVEKKKPKAEEINDRIEFVIMEKQ